MSNSRGLGGRHGVDDVGGHGQVGGAKGVTPMRLGANLPLHCTVEGDKLQLTGCPCLGRRKKAIPGRAIVGEGIGGEESQGGYGCQPIVCDGRGGSSGLFLGVIKAVDKLRHSRVFRPPQMHGGEHGDDVGLLNPSTVS